MKVLILGRTNVGKSSLFNRLIRGRKSLVIHESGITRDLLKGVVEWWGHKFEVMDSGGIPESREKDDLSREILKKIKQALTQADVLIVVVDGRTGLHTRDSQAVQMARKTGKPFLLFVNKVDKPAQTDLLTAPFFKLSTNLLSGSFEKNYGVDEIVEWIILQKNQNQITVKAKKSGQPEKKFRQEEKKQNLLRKPPKKFPSPQASASARKHPQAAQPRQTSPQNLIKQPRQQKGKASDLRQEDLNSPFQSENTNFILNKQPKADKKSTPVKLFVIGRANSGKSLLCNQILQTDRMIVSAKSGTTLDTVTEFFSYNKTDYSISDNPGSRRGNREKKEKISFTKSRSELKTADIVILVMDVQSGPSRQDARLVQMCLEKCKPVILAVNKMDLLKTLSTEEKKKKQNEIKKTFHFYPDIPIVFISAKTGYHKNQLFKSIESLKQKINFRISTSELNRFFTKVIRKAPAPVYGTSDVKFYYINQTNKKPPEFIAFANYPKGVTSAYKRFIVNKIKKKWNLKGIPISFHALSKR